MRVEGTFECVNGRTYAMGSPVGQSNSSLRHFQKNVKNNYKFLKQIQSWFVVEKWDGSRRHKVTNKKEPLSTLESLTCVTGHRSLDRPTGRSRGSSSGCS
jgi:hypothetical protein